MATYCFDFDGTLCSNTNGAYDTATPKFNRIRKVNELYMEGHTILIFTARGTQTGINWKELTEAQLADWRVSYSDLILGKPFADIYVDDRGLRDVDFFLDEPKDQ